MQHYYKNTALLKIILILYIFLKQIPFLHHLIVLRLDIKVVISIDASLY